MWVACEVVWDWFGVGVGVVWERCGGGVWVVWGWCVGGVRGGVGVGTAPELLRPPSTALAVVCQPWLGGLAVAQ